jgi:GrpB-like predicted nucleotidyltransferase (UPF0157 family)
VGIRSDPVTGRTWETGNRFSVNAGSAISTKGRMRFVIFTEAFTAEVMCRFLDRLASHFDRKVHLLIDGHSAHRSKKVRDWLATHPDELANADLKHSLPKQHRAPDQTELNPETRRFFRRRQRQPHIVRCYFGGPHVRYVLDENPLSF